MLKLTAKFINDEPIENILKCLAAKGELKLSGNMVTLDGKFSTKYRFSNKLNIVNSFNIEMPKGKPFNFIKSFYFSDLEHKDAVNETFSWFKKYYNIVDDFSLSKKSNTKFMKDLEKRNKELAIIQEKENMRIEKSRLTFAPKFKSLKTIYSDPIIKYFKEERGISEDTLRSNNARTGIFSHKGKIYKNRIFLPIKTVINEKKVRIVGIKMRDIFTKDSNYKSINISDSQMGCFINLDDVRGQKDVYLCEGEMDMFSLYEAGMKNNIGIAMGTHSFNEQILPFFKDAQQIKVLYDFDKKSMAGLKGVEKIISFFPEKEVLFLDFPKLVNTYFPDVKEEMLMEYSDVNDIWMSALRTGKTKEDFKRMIDTSLVSKSISEIQVLLENHKKMLEINGGECKITYIKKLGSIEDFSNLNLSV